MTLEKVEVNLASVFDSAQLYVARKLSPSPAVLVAKSFCSEQSHMLGGLEGYCTSEEHPSRHRSPG
jgi:hypothetical protein